MEKSEYQKQIMFPIMDGLYDEFLDSIILTVKERKRDMAPRIWEFNTGDRVKFINANPKYLVGAQGTIKKINRTKVVVDLDQQTGRFWRNITTPLSMLEKVY